MAWKSIADLIVPAGAAEIALLGAPMEAGSVTPGRCDLAPAALRALLPRFSTYDVDRRRELSRPIRDRGDVEVRGLSPEAGFRPIVEAVRQSVAAHRLTLLVGGNNAVTRPAVHALGDELEGTGLLTLDAHFDLRETDRGMMNGNPIRALLDDGMPGRNICQIGLLPFANTRKMHEDALAAGIGVWTMRDCRESGIETVLEAALDRLSGLDRLIVDFDIDVVDRSECPGTPGGRPGAMPATMFLEAARRLATDPRVRLVDLTEFDPGLDIGQSTAFLAARWLCEIASGYADRFDRTGPRVEVGTVGT